MEWTYDDAGFRIAETTPSEARRFRWDGETMAFETNVLGNLLMRYDHGPDRLLAETEVGSTRTWLTDALKTPVKRLTDTGTTYSVTRYDEYGEVEEETSPDVPRLGFTGHQRGPAEAPDLYYAQQRWYNAATGRFISEDPVWGKPKRPPSLHRYLYAYANPTVFVDPDGRMGLPNSWSEMPGYEAPEPCELCYVDGSPELKQEIWEGLTPEQREAYARPTAMMIRESEESISVLEERVGQANSALDAFGQSSYQVPREYRSLFGSRDDHYNALLRDKKNAERRLDRARLQQKFARGTQTAVNAAGTGAAIGGAGLACASGVGCAAGVVLATVALDQYLADEGVTERSVTTEISTFVIMQTGITDDQQATGKLVENNYSGS